MRVFIYLLLFVSILFAGGKVVSLSYLDSSDKVGLNDVRTMQFKSLQNNFLNQGLKKSPTWLKVELTNPTNKDKNLIIELQNPSIDHIAFYDGDRVVKTGDKHLNNSRDVESIAFAFEVRLSSKSSKTVYIRIKSNNPLSIPIFVGSKDSFFKFQVDLLKVLFIFLGYMGAFIVYNFSMYLNLKEKPYLFYVLFQLTFTLLLLAYSGIGINYIWVDNFFINEFIEAYFDDIALLLFLYFLLFCLQINRYFQRVYFIAKVMIFFIILEVIFRGTVIHTILVKPVMIGTILLILYILILSLKRGILFSNYIFLGSLFLIVGSLTTLLKNFGYLPINSFTNWSIYIFVMLEATLFSLVMAKKVELIKEHEKRMEIEQKEALQKEVDKKTQSLKLLLQELNHRVKNNLQIILSFISMASYKSRDKKIFQALKNRVHTVATLHTKLYKVDSVEQSDLKSYIVDIVENDKGIFDKNVEIVYDIKVKYFDMKKSTAIGLIVNEIVSNMLEHAFKSVKNPKIEIKFIFKDGKYHLKLKDNGIGFDKDSTKGGLGLSLVERLVKGELNSQLVIKSTENGSEFIVEFS